MTPAINSSAPTLEMRNAGLRQIFLSAVVILFAALDAEKLKTIP